MPRVVSFIVLLAILLLMGAVFFQVMAHFVVPLFLAAVLVVVFKPLHAWVMQHIPGYPRLAALATTLLIMLAVLLPTVWLGWKAALEFRSVYTYLSAAPPHAQNTADGGAEYDEAASADSVAKDAGINEKVLATVVARAPAQLKELYKSLTNNEFDEETLRNLLANTRGMIGAVAVSGAQIAVKLLFGLAIMTLALYYFLADGPKMLVSLMKLSPLDDEYERELLDKFANISRAVVVASLASAVAQGLLAGVGYFFALDEGAPIFLLTMLTMVLAIVPFAGAAAVWIPTAIWIYLYQPVYENGQPLLDAAGNPVQGDAFKAICLGLYGVCIVSAIDNVIKPLILHGQSNLHPLVALISILGGVQTLGPIGILVGPMLVAFIQALLNMINKELLRLGHGTLAAKPGARGTPMPLGPATQIEAEAAAASSSGVLDKLLSPGDPSPPRSGHSDNPASSRRVKRRRK